MDNDQFAIIVCIKLGTNMIRWDYLKFANRFTI